MIKRYHANPPPFSLGYTFIYSLPVIVVNRDDSVTINFFNIAETEDEEKEEEGQKKKKKDIHSQSIPRHIA